jgi:hypothetical protein
VSERAGATFSEASSKSGRSGSDGATGREGPAAGAAPSLGRGESSGGGGGIAARLAKYLKVNGWRSRFQKKKNSRGRELAAATYSTKTHAAVGRGQRVPWVTEAMGSMRFMGLG